MTLEEDGRGSTFSIDGMMVERVNNAKKWELLSLEVRDMDENFTSRSTEARSDRPIHYRGGYSFKMTLIKLPLI